MGAGSVLVLDLEILLLKFINNWSDKPTMREFSEGKPNFVVCGSSTNLPSGL